MAKFEHIRFFLISPRELAVPDYVRAFMLENEMKFTEVTGLEAVIPQLDVLYMTRIQRERFVDPLEYERNKGIYILTRRKLDRAKEKMLVMHPCPGWMRLLWMWMTIPGRPIFSRLGTGCLHGWPCCPTWRTSPGWNGREAVEIGTKPVCSNPRCITQTQPYLPPLVKKNGGVDCCAFCDTALR